MTSIALFVRIDCRVSFVSAILLASALAPLGRAQWTAVTLQPSGAYYSWGTAAQGGQQAGYADTGLGRSAFLWSGTASSAISLNPSGSTWSEAHGVGNGQQVGLAVVGNAAHASLWTGTAASWVDLHPAGAVSSRAVGVGDGQQVGLAEMSDGSTQAGYWTGTAASWVDLTPPGPVGFVDVWATQGGQQVGRVGAHAALWSGSPDSWVDLNPPGSGITGSVAYGISGGQQVGGVGLSEILPGTLIPHAALWSGSSSSWIDLHPSSLPSPTQEHSSYSVARAVHDGQQVGTVSFIDPGTGSYHASLWSGTASSWVDLHAYLPPGYDLSEAFGIWHDVNRTYVVGYALSSVGLPQTAVLWISPPVCQGTPASAVTYGAGKPGGVGVPSLTSFWPPQLGGTSELRISGITQQAGPAYLFAGFSPALLPFDGGTLLVNPFTMFGFPLFGGLGGQSTLQVSLPSDSSLCGYDVYFQAVIVDPAAVGIHHTAQTNGLHWVLGS